MSRRPARWMLMFALAAVSGCRVGAKAPAPEPRQATAREETASPLPANLPPQAGFFHDLVPYAKDRAASVFQLERESHEEPLQAFLTVVGREGRPVWVHALPKNVGPSIATHDPAMHVVGDVVTVLLQSHARADDDRSPYLGVHAFSIDDGAPRWHDDEGYTPDLGEQALMPEAAASDRSQRFDFASKRGFRLGRSLTAYGPQGKQWSTAVGDYHFGGRHTVLTDTRLAFREEIRGGVHWRVLDRKTGLEVMALDGRTQACHDGRDLYVVDDAGLVHVDLRRLSKRRLATGPMAPRGLRGKWRIADCGVLGHDPVAYLTRGPNKALAILDAGSGAITRTVALGLWAPGDGHDPMPERLQPVTAFSGFHEQMGAGVLVVDLEAGKIVWHSGTEDPDDYTGYVMVLHAGKHAVLATDADAVLGVLDPRSGRLARSFATPRRWTPNPASLHGSELWLPPGDRVHLGYAAPKIVDLAHVPDEPSVRPKLLDALRLEPDGTPKGTGPRTSGNCPDPTRFVRGDGAGLAKPMGKVAKGRLPAWDLDALADGARMYACAPGTAKVHLMAWYVIEDTRPLRNHHALMLIQHEGYTLVQVYRHATNDGWNINTSFHSRAEPVTKYKSRPTNADVYKVLKKNRWTFKHRDDWKILAGNVLDKTWKLATGKAPTKKFPRGIEQKG